MNSATVSKGASKEMESILSAALALSPADREELAERIMASLNGVESAELSADQVAMLQRRLADVKEGKVRSIPAEDALRMAKARQKP